jgi:predicted TIM-barrel fold metal-dependent hydrolase
MSHDCLRELRLRDFRPRTALRVPSTSVPRARYRAIDAHNHLGRWLAPHGRWVEDDLAGGPVGAPWSVPDVDALLGLMDAVGLEAIVNLDGRWDDELEANLDRYDRAHPGRFATFCQLDWRRADEPGALVRSLERSAAAGARGLKVWKTLGLGFRDAHGRLRMPDDGALNAVWEAAGALGLPVLIHVADPPAFFDPVDARNEQLEVLLEHPDWSYADPALPCFDRLIEALEKICARHRGTTFVGAHVASCGEDLTRLGRMLDDHPNLNVDISARLYELGRQPRAARRLIGRHPDRVLFGTDAFPPDAEMYALHFRFLESDDEQFDYCDVDPPPLGRWRISALELADDALRAVYRDNALRVLGMGAAASDAVAARPG